MIQIDATEMYFSILNQKKNDLKKRAQVSFQVETGRNHGRGSRRKEEMRKDRQCFLLRATQLVLVSLPALL